MAEVVSSQRLYSLDALRGFDMFWIMGGASVVGSLTKATGAPFLEVINEQLEHPAWHGFHFYDLIFPLFLFMAGVATPYSVGRELEMGKSKKKLLLKIIRRGLTLVLLGIIVNNHLKIMPISEVRFGSVLGHIGLAYMFANIIYLYTSTKGQIIWFCSILIGYWLLFMLAAAPGYPHGDFTMQGNIVSYLDRVVMPGKLYLGIHDPEGLVSTVPAISTALLGVLAGNLLRNSSLTGEKKTLQLLIGGIVFLVLAQIWNIFFPINKNLWTSSFVLRTGGLSLILLSIFYYIIDVRGYKKWAFFFKVIGMNSILIYMSGQFIDFRYTTNAFFQWLIQLVGEPFDIVVFSICFLAIKWLFLYFLYRKKVFLRV
ncbi:MAG: DUF5009 domain-containing protein [Chitinophagaceae bacterium]